MKNIYVAVTGHSWYNRTEMQNLLVRAMESYNPITIRNSGLPWNTARKINAVVVIAEPNQQDIVWYDNPEKHLFSDAARHLENLLEHEKEYGATNARRLIVPLAINENHFVLVAGDLTPGKETFVYCDPFGNAPPEKIVEAIRKHYPDKQIFYSTVKQQVNECDCGPLLVQNARDIIVDGSLSIQQPLPLYSELRARHANALQRDPQTGTDRYSELPSLDQSIDRTQFARVADKPKRIVFRPVQKTEQCGGGSGFGGSPDNSDPRTPYHHQPSEREEAFDFNAPKRGIVQLRMRKKGEGQER